MIVSNRNRITLAARPRVANGNPKRRGRWLTGTAIAALWSVAGGAAMAQTHLPGTLDPNMPAQGVTNFGAINGIQGMP